MGSMVNITENKNELKSDEYLSQFSHTNNQKKYYFWNLNQINLSNLYFDN